MAVVGIGKKFLSKMSDESELKKRGYNLGHTLGEGSYAKVKLALCDRTSKNVAIKVINRKKAPKDFQEKFLPRELDVLKKLSHPHIVQMYEVMQFNSKVFIVMEMAGHGDLLEYIKLRGAIPEDKSRVWFAQVIEGIDFCHKNSIVHRDLKCENLLLDSENRIKISDFGFARYIEPCEHSSTFCGSAAYAAPEILQGIPYEATAYDIWSMGIILYIMVCGSMPYDDSNIKKMIRMQTERKVGFAKSKKISHNCKKLIHAMLEASVNKRAKVADLRKSDWIMAAKLNLTVTKNDKQLSPSNSKENRQLAAKVLSDRSSKMDSGIESDVGPSSTCAS
ncbi:testis-specific serine/threonine-protein kinase 1-like [Tubulanus polymorphus]|uniref:testis-specific serine/threonine-protein kinase 1-like n=1 Tax=Tubulanus polymorphus TaxID=672921 RepID=UPI003DA6A30C